MGRYRTCLKYVLRILCTGTDGCLGNAALLKHIEEEFHTLFRIFTSEGDLCRVVRIEILHAELIEHGSGTLLRVVNHERSRNLLILFRYLFYCRGELIPCPAFL